MSTNEAIAALVYSVLTLTVLKRLIKPIYVDIFGDKVTKTIKRKAVDFTLGTVPLGLFYKIYFNIKPKSFGICQKLRV